MAGKCRPAYRAGRARRWLAGSSRRWVAPLSAALIGSTAVCIAPAAQAAPGSGSPTIVVSGDSVLATSVSSFGPATVTATRPDARTGAPVVIGTFSGQATPLTPFSVNATTPTPLSPAGDCWQKGALSQALTPDLQPSDTVTVTQPGFLGGAASSTSIAVTQADLSSAVLGPIAGCSSIARWAHNAITSAPSGVKSGVPLSVSGVAQPLATAVSVSASDGTKTTEPIDVTPAADGTWTATIPASALARLANTKLAVTPVFAVPDVSTGDQAHIDGVGASVDKTAA